MAQTPLDQEVLKQTLKEAMAEVFHCFAGGLSSQRCAPLGPGACQIGMSRGVDLAASQAGPPTFS